MNDGLTPAACKKVVKDFLDERGLPYTRLTAKTIDFTDLARASVVFVTVHGWEAASAWDEVKALAVANGFRVQ